MNKKTFDFMNKVTWFGVDYFQIVRLIAGVVLFCLGVFLPLGEKITAIIMLLCYVLCGYDVVLRAVNNVLESRYLDENLMIFVASAAAFFIGAPYEAAAVMIIYQVGVVLRAYTAEELRCRLDDQLGFYPSVVSVKREDGEEEVYSENIAAEDVFVVRAGEMFPVDCIVEEGSAVVDRSLLCGDGEPVLSVECGGKVYAGCVNVHSDVTVRALATADESMVAKLKSYSMDEKNGRGDAAFFIERIAHVYAPFALGLCVLIALVASIFAAGPIGDTIHRALIVLIITCPSTFLVSIPLTYLAGIRGIMRDGVLVKGPAVLDDLTRVSDILFDKEGMITTGKYRIISIKSTRMDPAVLLKVAAHTQANASGAIAETIVHAYEGVIDRAIIHSFEEYEDGVIAEINQIPIAMGSYEFLKGMGAQGLCANDGSLSVYMTVGGQFAGQIVLGDIIRNSAASMLLNFDDVGCNSIMLTSDTPELARATAEAVGIRDYHSLCMPMDKLAIVQDMKESRPQDCVLFIAAGTDETPALAAADIGVTLYGASSEGAIETGDVVVMNHNPEKLANAISIARDVHKIIRQNLLGVAAVKVILLVLALIGVSYQLWFAFFVDIIASVVCMLNSYRAFPKEKEEDLF